MLEARTFKVEVEKLIVPEAVKPYRVIVKIVISENSFMQRIQNVHELAWIGYEHSPILARLILRKPINSFVLHRNLMGFKQPKEFMVFFTHDGGVYDFPYQIAQNIFATEIENFLKKHLSAEYGKYVKLVHEAKLYNARARK